MARSKLSNFDSGGNAGVVSVKLRVVRIMALCLALLPTMASAGTCTERQQVCLAYCAKNYNNAPKCLEACSNYRTDGLSTGCFETKITAKQCGFTRR